MWDNNCIVCKKVVRESYISLVNTDVKRDAVEVLLPQLPEPPPEETHEERCMREAVECVARYRDDPNHDLPTLEQLLKAVDAMMGGRAIQIRQSPLCRECWDQYEWYAQTYEHAGRRDEATILFLVASWLVGRTKERPSGVLNDRTGQRYGRLIVEGRVPNRPGRAYLTVRCDCGQTSIVRSDNLKNKDPEHGCCCKKSGHALV